MNQYNDNYDYFYVKIADASRVYGLEFEDILSPNRINYVLNGFTLVEEHIIGIPGDQFIRENFDNPRTNTTRVAKEFVKFNERCFVRLLGDMRSYNFVIDTMEDFDDTQYRFRAIDFDQQCYEGKKNLYLPQFFNYSDPAGRQRMEVAIAVANWRLQGIADARNIPTLRLNEVSKWATSLDPLIVGGIELRKVPPGIADNPPIDLRRPIAAWQVTMDDGAHFYVDSASGQILATRTRWWRFYDLMWGLHIMDPQTREDTHNPFVILFGVVALGMSVLGTILLPMTLKKKRNGKSPSA